MSKAKSGDTVRIHYKGTLSDGTLFDSSEGRDPLEFQVGSGRFQALFHLQQDRLDVVDADLVCGCAVDAIPLDRRARIGCR